MSNCTRPCQHLTHSKINCKSHPIIQSFFLNTAPTVQEWRLDWKTNETKEYAIPDSPKGGNLGQSVRTRNRPKQDCSTVLVPGRMCFNLITPTFLTNGSMLGSKDGTPTDDARFDVLPNTVLKLQKELEIITANKCDPTNSNNPPSGCHHGFCPSPSKKAGNVGNIPDNSLWERNFNFFNPTELHPHSALPRRLAVLQSNCLNH